jgi:hypothetical protein
MRKMTAALGAAMGAGALVCGSTAHAQEASYLQQSVPAPSNALELRVGTGYTQGFGNILPGQGISRVAGPGVGVDVGVAHRVSPHWSYGMEAEYQEFGSGLNAAARGVSLGLGATDHLNPTLRGDPYVRVGGGYRMVWSVNPPGAPTTTIHGLELAKGTLGYDVRVSPDIAISPQVGVGLDMFIFQNTSGVNRGLSPQVTAFIFAGLGGRFDLGGTRGPAANVAAR